MTNSQIRHATTPDDMDAVRQLCWDFRSFLTNVSPVNALITETFYPVPKYTALMETLEAEHARPTGIILLARLEDGTPAGCAMTHAITPQISEVKRVYVSPEARGRGIARKLMIASMEQARADGFTQMVLDTSHDLAPAQALYDALGFTRCGPYQDIPTSMLPHLVFFKTDL